MKKKKVFCIMTHDSSPESNVGMVVQYLKRISSDYTFYYIRKGQVKSVRTAASKFTDILDFFIKKPYHLATSAYVLQDNVFLPFSFIRFRKKVKVIQLWHGTGTIKKFGQDANTGQLKRLEYRANRTITHLIVNSLKMKEQYAGAFGISTDRIFVYGLPRTDLLFDRNIKKRAEEEFFLQYPELRDKRLLLYAPTFRDSMVDDPALELDLDKFFGLLPSDMVLMLKLHPHVANNFELSPLQKEKYAERIIDLSRAGQINTVMEVSDILITDYSSLIFEYCIQGKPMIFYAYDLEDFSNNGRGFYEPYKQFVPGPVAITTEELIRCILDAESEPHKNIKIIEAFRDEHFDYFDGQSTKRTASLFQ